MIAHVVLEGKAFQSLCEGICSLLRKDLALLS